MTSLVGNEAARATFLAAMRGPAMHHAWLFAGPDGVGKGTFARAAAARLLAEAAAPGTPGAALALPADHPTRAFLAAVGPAERAVGTECVSYCWFRVSSCYLQINMK